MIKGPAAQHFQLHFAQRWSYAFTHDPSKTRNLTHYIPHTVPTPSPPKKPTSMLRLKLSILPEKGLQA